MRFFLPFITAPKSRCNAIPNSSFYVANEVTHDSPATQNLYNNTKINPHHPQKKDSWEEMGSIRLACA